MVPWWWSFLLTAVGVFGLWVSSTGRSWGFLVGLTAQVLWVVYALATEQYGFLISAALYGVMYFRNFQTWREKRRGDASDILSTDHDYR